MDETLISPATGARALTELAVLYGKEMDSNAFVAGIVPGPSQMKPGKGYFTLGPECSVSLEDDSLLELRDVLCRGISALTKYDLSAAAPSPGNGLVILGYDHGLSEEAYRLEVEVNKVRILGGDYCGAAHGAASFLQLLQVRAEKTVCPCLVIEDRPALPFRGLMVDLARHNHSPVTIRQLIVLCWWYKIRYLQLHLTDIQAFTFPSAAFPDLASRHNAFILNELKALESFAQKYGVTIIPELDVPGHANSALRTLCPTEPHNDWNAINPVHPKTHEVLDTLIGEICDVFGSSPYFHIGGDELVFKAWEDCSICHRFMRENGLEEFRELFNLFLANTSEIVKRHGRRSIVWEGFDPASRIKVPTDVIVQCYEMAYAMPDALIANGYEIINASWVPLYLAGSAKRSPVELIYQWHARAFGSDGAHTIPGLAEWLAGCDKLSEPATFPPNSSSDRPPFVRAIPEHESLCGAMMCSWEQPECMELPTLRRRLAAMSERTWNPDRREDYGDFLIKLERRDEQLELLLTDVLKTHTNLFTVISRAQEIAARLQAGQKIGMGRNTKQETEGL